MKKLFFMIILILLISSCLIQELILRVDKNIFAVIPHHNIVNKEIDDYYSLLKNKHGDFDNIVIISPNHFSDDFFTINQEWKYCFTFIKEDCISLKKINTLDSIKNLENSFFNKDWYIDTKEHWIWNHFQFINKYFSDSNIYSILLNIETKKDNELLNLKEKLINYPFKWKTLFIASVDFSHHVNEKIAVFHDLNTINFLNNWIEKNIEVDCPNCLYLIKDLADYNNKNYFNLYNRTSVDKKLKINSNYDNTSHIYWEFEKSKKSNKESVFSWSYMYSKFDNLVYSKSYYNEISWVFFWDTHFTRWLISEENSFTIENHLMCFYSNKDLNRIPKYWHNRFLYSFDFVGLNLETSIWKKDQCSSLDKQVIFQTDPKYIEKFKDIWFNLFNLANNHSYDCWEVWFEYTKKNLENMDLLYYWDLKWNDEYVLKKEINGTKIAFLWFNDIWEQIDGNEKLKKIEKLTNEWYIVIINIHWWFEYDWKSNKRQQRLAKSFIDSWAKLIVWHHPHVIQEYEVYKWVPIFYSLWNFIFDQSFWDTAKWYWLFYSINWKWIKYNLLEFKKNENNFLMDCDSFK